MHDSSETWLQENLQNAISQGSLDPCEMFLLPEGLRLLKAIGEISYFSTYGSFETSTAFLDFIKRCLEPIVTHKGFFSLMRFNTDYSTLFLSICDVSLRLGLIEGSRRVSLTKLCGLYGVMGPERVPFRQLDLYYGLENLGHPLDFGVRDLITKHGCFSSSKRLLNIQKNDAYALTHTIFYITDFGRNPRNVEEHLLEDAIFAMKRLCHAAVLDEDMDLLAEYILCFAYLNRVDEDVVEFIALLKSYKNSDGVWVGPGSIEDALTKLKIDPSLYPFYSNYHTTLLCWQAEKVAETGRPENARKAPICALNSAAEGDAPYYLHIQAEIDALLEAGETSIDFAFVLWVASKLGMGYGEIIEEIGAQVNLLDESAPSVELDKVRFIADLPISSCYEHKDNVHCATDADFWRLMFVLSNCGPKAKARRVRNILAIEYEHNRGVYVRVLALALVWNILQASDLDREMYYLDSLYAPDGAFLWREIAPEKRGMHVIHDLLGKILLYRYHKARD